MIKTAAKMICFWGLLMVQGLPAIHAEIILRPNGQLSTARTSQEPHRGQSEQKVAQQFGPPLKILPPLKTAPHYPTISRWVYSKFTVYFGNGRVIDTVIHPAPKTPASTEHAN